MLGVARVLVQLVQAPQIAGDVLLVLRVDCVQLAFRDVFREQGMQEKLRESVSRTSNKYTT